MNKKIKETQESTEGQQDTEIQQAEESMAALKAEIQELQTSLKEQKDLLLRAKAETENTRRRAAEDIQNAHKYAINKFVTELLPVKDSLEMALMDESSQFETLKQGVDMTLKQLIVAFERGQVKEINPLGEKLDPNWHQAMTTEESDAEPNTVTKVLQKGYMVADRLVRPALVIVAAPK